MKKNITLLFVLLLAACSDEVTVPTLTDPSPEQALQSSKSGLSLSLAKETYDQSFLSIETTIKNESQQTYGFGAYYYIEVNKNGEWYIVTHSDAVFLKNKQFTDSGQLLLAGSEVKLTFSLEPLGITLVPGEYRLVKTFLTQTEPFFEITIAAPFKVK